MIKGANLNTKWLTMTEQLDVGKVKLPETDLKAEGSEQGISIECGQLSPRRQRIPIWTSNLLITCLSAKRRQVPDIGGGKLPQLHILALLCEHPSRYPCVLRW